MEHTEEIWFTSKEVALRLKVEVNTLDKWAWAGTGPDYIKPGRSRRYAIEDILAWERKLREEAKLRRQIAQAHLRRRAA